jgi:DNA-binding response OmpR family regulator
MDQRIVLVVEDDDAIRAVIAEALDDGGYTVVEADRGVLALRLAQDHLPSVVLVDHLLPDMSGLDLLERLRSVEATRHIPVMVVTGLAQQLTGRDHGADSVLAKPFDIEVLLERVNALAHVDQRSVA